jgi:group I intron endonuclease
MPYAKDYIGIYKIVNSATGACYIGQSQRVKKRIKEHFRLLKLNTHTNQKLQRAFNKYGEDSFSWKLEIECTDTNELDKLEECFLQGEATFIEPMVYNIANHAKVPMRGKRHTTETKQKLSVARLAAEHKYSTEQYKKNLKAAHFKRLMENKEYVAKIKFIVDNSDMSYAERGRILGTDASSVRKINVRYSYLKGVL